MRAAISRELIGSRRRTRNSLIRPVCCDEDLPGLGEHIGGALVDLAHAGMEEADHLRVDARAFAGLQRDVGADAGADLFRQPVAEDDGVGGAVERGERGAAHLLGQVGHLGFAPRIDADHAGGDVVVGVADDRLHLHRRPDRARQPGFQRRHAGERVLDAAPARFRRQAVDFRAGVECLGRLRRRRAAFVRHGDMRQRIDQPRGEIVLRALHQRGHHDREADTGGDAGDREAGLAHAGAHMRPGDIEDEVHPEPRSFPRKRESRATTKAPANSALGPRFRGDERVIDRAFMARQRSRGRGRRP